MGCPEENEILGYLLRSLEPLELHEIEQHLDACETCRALVAKLAKASMSILTHDPEIVTNSLHPSPRLLLRGEQLGRFVIESTLGSGGMGIVYKAKDTVLDREVALKVIHEPRSSREDLKKRMETIQREARAMAQLNHPNVVTVYDVGQTRSVVFISMELVLGETLRAWLDRRRRSLSEIVGAFLEAGRGLAAAHAAGVIHRDFKPQNVLMGHDGRVAVADFGLALSTLDEKSEGASQELAGTPAYMAPEQRQRGKVDEKSDQYSFCLSLSEALTENHANQRAKREEDTVAAGGGRRIPRWLSLVLQRGMSKLPEDRHKSVGDVVDLLEGIPRRRRRILFGTLSLLVAIGIAGLLVYSDATSDVRECRRGTEELQRAWEERQVPLEGSVRRANGDLGPTLWSLLVREIDGFIEGWSDRYHRTCSETFEEKSQTRHTHELTIRCLRRSREELESVLRILEENPEVASNIVESRSLFEGRLCENVEILTARVPPPQSGVQQQHIDEMFSKIADIKAGEAAGLHRRFVARAEKVAAEAEQIGYKPLFAESLYWLGKVQQRSARYEEAAKSLEKSGRVALAGRDFEVAARSWILLIRVYGEDLGGPENRTRATELAGLVEALIDGLAPVPNLNAQLHRELGHVHFHKASYDEALEHYGIARDVQRRIGDVGMESANTDCAISRTLMALGRYQTSLEKYRGCISLLRREIGPSHPNLAAWLNNYGIALKRAGKSNEAFEVFEQSLEMYETTSRANHPSQADCLVSVASLLRHKGQYDESLRRYLKARAIILENHGPRHIRMTHLENNIGNLYISLGKIDEARSAHERALELRLELLGPTHWETMISYLNLGDILQIEDQPQRALESYTKALDGLRPHFGEDHKFVSIALYSLAGVYLDQGQYREALDHYALSIEIQKKALEPGNAAFGTTYTGYGRALLGLGKPGQALQYLNKAWALRRSGKVEPYEEADTSFALARALWEEGIQKEAAIEHAKRALELMEGQRRPQGPPKREIQQWLTARRPSESQR